MVFYLMYIGRNRAKRKCHKLNWESVHVLKETEEEKDLGVFVSNKFRCKKQITTAAARANMVLGQIKNQHSSWVWCK